MGKETTFAVDDAEKLHFTRLRKSALPADTGRAQQWERTRGIRSLLEIDYSLFFKILKFVNHSRPLLVNRPRAQEIKRIFDFCAEIQSLHEIWKISNFSTEN